MNLKDYITTIPDFPKKGIMFRDCTTLISNPKAFGYSVEQMCKFAEMVGANVVVGPEARGFIFGAPVAYKLGVGFITVRKPGKLPREQVVVDYSLEYGSNQLCIHTDSLKEGDKVLIVDDLLATGGTTKACVELCQRLGAKVVGAAFAIELTDLGGRDKFDFPIYSLTTYVGD